MRWWQDSFSDIRFAVRTLRKAPVFTVTVVAALALCIGINTAIFSVVDTVLFRPLSFPDQQRLVAVTEGIPGLGFPVVPFSPPDYLFVTANNDSFAATGAYRTQSYEISGVGRPRRVTGARMTASLFQVLGITPMAGRSFTKEEEEQSKRLAVLNFGFARSAFGSTEQALGRTVQLNRIPYTIIGVMPPSFSFPIRGSRFNADPADMFVPVSWSREDRAQNVSNFDYSMVARLKPNVALEQANAELQRLVKLIVADYPAKIKQALDRMPNFSLESRAVPFREEFAGDVRRPLLLLMAAVGVVLLIGCADVANLMFSRMVSRRREFALRSALGAGRWRLARQALAEGLVLAVSGGMVGFFLAVWTLPLLVRFAPENLPRITEVGFDWRVSVFVVVVTLATPLLFCLAPLAGTVRASLADRFRGEGRTTTVGRNQRLVMSGAVVFQFSLAFLLLTATGLLSKSLIRAIESDPGFRPQRLVSTRIALPDAVYKTSDEITTFFNRLFERINALPGVRQTGAISDLPMRSTSNVVISIEGRGIETERVDVAFCRGNALDALGVGLLRGRLLQPEDQFGKLPAVVISEGLAKRISPNGNPLGHRIRFGVDVPNNNNRWLTVVGVVADVKATLTSNASRLLLFATPTDWVKQMDVLVQTADDPLALANAIRHEVALLDPNLSLGKVETLDDVLDQSLSAERFRTWLLACFATAALLLTTLGIAGLLAHNVAKRTQEFGVRMALGADGRALMALVFGHSLRLSLTGIVVGLAVSVVAMRLISALLYETSPFDLATFLAVAAILVVVAIAAAFLPAWRASRTTPLVALRSE